MSECLPELRQYYTFRKDLLVEFGIILKREHIALPTSKRPDMLNNLNSSYQGHEKNTLHVEKTAYLP